MKGVSALPITTSHIRASPGKVMLTSGALALVLGAAFSVAAAVAHLACIALGAPAYRFMGAGEKMARAAEAGSVRPALLTLLLGLVHGYGVIALWPAL